MHYLELRIQQVRNLIAQAVAKWKSLSQKAKAGWATLFFCILWLPLGGWVLLFIPMVVVKDILIRVFWYILGKTGLEIAFRKLVNFLYVTLVPRSLRAGWHWRVSRRVYAKRREVRRKIQDTNLGKNVVQYAKKSGRALKAQLDPRVEKSKSGNT